MIDVAPGTVVIYADIACPWATLCMIRLWAARERAGVVDDVRLDWRAFPLELFNARPTPRQVLDAEIPVVGAHQPDFGWSPWRGKLDQYAVSSLLALEAVQAAKEQGLAASEQLDRELRRAFFADSRCITLRSEVERVARSCDALDADELMAALDDGRARRTVIEQWRTAAGDEIKGSPHVLTPDGSDWANPGITMHWTGEHGRGVPVIDADDPAVYDDILRSAVGG